jgi:hypothetical protein
MHVEEFVGQPQVVISLAQMPEHIVFGNVFSQCLDETLALEVPDRF